MNLRPQSNHLLVRRVEPSSVSKGGIIIPDTAKKKPFEAEVLAVGPGWRDDNGRLHLVSIQPGEKVFFGAYAGTQVGEQLFMPDDNVLAVLGADGESLRAYQDNCVIVFEPVESMSTLLTIIDQKPKHRLAKVMLSGPGYVTRTGAFVENTVRERDRVIVDALAGQDYSLDVNIPRRVNKASDFESMFGHSGNFRIIREGEVLGVVEADARVVH